MSLTEFLRILPLLLIMLASVVGVVLFVRWACGDYLFRWDARNPYRRWCRRCGQEQNQYKRSYDGNITWWENVGPEPDLTCACHRYQEYRH